MLTSLKKAKNANVPDAQKSVSKHQSNVGDAAVGAKKNLSSLLRSSLQNGASSTKLNC